MLDLIIIGAGPAGITASVYAARKRMEFLVISQDIGGQTAWSGDIENYTGYRFITGPELTARFEEHMREYGIKVNEGERARAVGKTGNSISVKTDKADYEARTVIIASGKRTRELNVPGEKEYKNKGLTYCATCDGPLFNGRDVAIIGAGNSALDAALQLINIASRVYVVNINRDFTGDPIMREKVVANNKVEVLSETKVTEILGEKTVNGIRIKRQQKEEVIPVKGVFVEIGLVPNSELAPSLEKNEIGEIRVDNYNRTSVPGIFAAGDVTDVPEKQIIIAAGEGSKAALAAFRYIAQNKF